MLKEILHNMPTYTFLCEKCDHSFELNMSLSSYKNIQKCPKCKKAANRNYQTDLMTLNACVKLSDSEIKSMGHLANRNRDTLSDDHKQHLQIKHNEYREESTKPLPKNMSRMKKPTKKTKWT